MNPRPHCNFLGTNLAASWAGPDLGRQGGSSRGAGCSINQSRPLSDDRLQPMLLSVPVFTMQPGLNSRRHLLLDAGQGSSPQRFALRKVVDARRVADAGVEPGPDDESSVAAFDREHPLAHAVPRPLALTCPGSRRGSPVAHSARSKTSPDPGSRRTAVAALVSSAAGVIFVNGLFGSSIVEF